MRTVRIWDAVAGVLQQTLKIGTYLQEMSFNPHDSPLVSNTSAIILDLSCEAPTEPR
jgi:hypothetical protein